jgi:hypothetical protein
VVGKVRGLAATDAGLPTIGFTGLEALLASGYDQSFVEDLNPSEYVSVDCTFTEPKSSIFPVLDRCTGLSRPTVISALEYETAYDANVFRADRRLKDKEVVIHGEVRLVAQLIDGRTYVELHARKEFSAVTAIISPAAKRMIPEYAKEGEKAVMVCQGGYRYNLVGSVGLRNCRFLQNY